MMSNIYPTHDLRIGLTIGTFAAVPYVHLQLEALKRYEPNIPVIVCDDYSPAGTEISALCARYGATFRSTRQRMNPCVGDVACMVAGFDFAQALGLDIIVKWSRRWCVARPWSDDLAALAHASQHATFSSHCETFNFGFRTECVAFNVNSWFDNGGVKDLRNLVDANQSVFVEGHVHNLSRSIHQHADSYALAYEAKHPASADRNGYCHWPLLGTARTLVPNNILWHDLHTPQDYFALAQKWHIPYTHFDFLDPNSGFGNGAH